MMRIGRLSEQREALYSEAIYDVLSTYNRLSEIEEKTSQQDAVMNSCLSHAQLFVDSDIAVARLSVVRRNEIKSIWEEEPSEPEGEPEGNNRG
jgi:hypothetical protein